jgi:L-cysteine desulfidase
VIEELEADETRSARAMAITSAMTVYVKGFIKRMTAFCGCSVAAAPGVAAATSYLLGGTWEDMEHSMQSVVGALSGMMCDGAKVSCAYKLSTAAAAAIEYAYLATREKVYIPAPNGIVSNDIKTTFLHLGRINNPGMLETDKMILSIIEENQASTHSYHDQ